MEFFRNKMIEPKISKRAKGSICNLPVEDLVVINGKDKGKVVFYHLRT